MILKEFETISEYVCKQTRWTDGSIRHDRMEDVVRCKDCIVFGTHGKNTDICPMWHNTHIDPYRDFCSRGVRKTENSSEKPNNCELQTIRCPKCGRTDYIRDMEKDMGIKGSHYKYKCINCNTYIKTEATISKMEQVEDEFKQFDREDLILLIECQKERIAELLADKDTPQTDSEITRNSLRTDCTGCKFVGWYDTDFPCVNCIRKNKDYYTSEQTEREGE